MAHLCFALMISFALLPICLGEGSDESEEEDETFWTKTYKSLTQLFPSWSSEEKPAADVNRVLISSTVKTSDVTQFKEKIRGVEFDIYDQKNFNYYKKGLPIKKFDQYFRQIAKVHNLPENIVVDAIFGKYSEVNQSQENSFVYRVGKTSVVTYCTFATVKNDENTIDVAMAFYSLDFKFADRELHHTEDEYLLGFFRWGTKHWKTYEPRKLTADDKDIFFDFLCHQAITGYI